MTPPEILVYVPPEKKNLGKRKIAEIPGARIIYVKPAYNEHLTEVKRDFYGQVREFIGKLPQDSTLIHVFSVQSLGPAALEWHRFITSYPAAQRRVVVRSINCVVREKEFTNVHLMDRQKIADHPAVVQETIRGLGKQGSACIRSIFSGSEL